VGKGRPKAQREKPEHYGEEDSVFTPEATELSGEWPIHKTAKRLTSDPLFVKPALIGLSLPANTGEHPA
jgi:hypothetical protein